MHLFLAVLLSVAPGLAADPDPACPAADTSVGEVAGRPITLAEVDARAAGALMEARRALYEARHDALEAMIDEALLAREAEARGLSAADLEAAEIDARLTTPSDAEIDEVYTANRDRLGGRPKEEVREGIVAWLRDQQRDGLRTPLLASLAAKHGVVRRLDPPRVAVSADDDAARGPATAPVTLIEFSDYQCPYCSRVEGTLAALRERYGDQLRVVYRDFPLQFHPHAEMAAQATECAEEHGKYWEMHDALFAQQDRLDRKDLVDVARGLKIPRKEFEACLDDGRYAAEVAHDLADGVAAGVRGTPAFFVNGIFLGGAQPLDAFVEVIDAELARGR